MKTTKIHKMYIYAKRKAQEFYKNISINGKKESIAPQQKPVEQVKTANASNIPLTNALHEHIFNTVIETIVSQVKGLPVKPEQISRENCVYGYLDIYPASLYCIFKELERKTLLNLEDKDADKFFVYFLYDKNGNMVYNVVTVGNICDFIEQKLLQANQADLLKAASDVAMKHQITINSNLGKQI